MKAIQFLGAENTISRHHRRLRQELTFNMLVENQAFEKLVEVHWAGEDKVWHTLAAELERAISADWEVWRAHTTLYPSPDCLLPGDVEFALRSRTDGKEHWDNNGSRNYLSSAAAGVLMDRDAQVLNIDYDQMLHAGQRSYPITVAVRHSLRPQGVQVHWTTDNWRTSGVTPCRFRRMHWGQWLRSRSRNPNRYDTSIWVSHIDVDDAYRLEYAIACDLPGRTIWDNNLGRNYVARRRRLRILTLNLHCYQEENQDWKLSQIARAINDLDIDVVCLQEVAENWCDGNGDWASNAARIIRERLRDHYHLHTDWSHIGFDRYREGIAILSRYDFLITDSGYVSASQDVHSIDSRKVAMVQIDVPYIGKVNVFSCHLSWLSGGFVDQFERLRNWANLKHGGDLAATFLCGDFNIKAGSEGYQAVLRTHDFEDQFLAATSRGVFEKIFRKHSPNAERYLAHDGRIDYIFMQQHSRLRAVKAREMFTNGDPYGPVSDHSGYYVEFEPK